MTRHDKGHAPEGVALVIVHHVRPILADSDAFFSINIPSHFCVESIYSRVAVVTETPCCHSNTWSACRPLKEH